MIQNKNKDNNKYKLRKSQYDRRVRNKRESRKRWDVRDRHISDVLEPIDRRMMCEFNFKRERSDTNSFTFLFGS